MKNHSNINITLPLLSLYRQQQAGATSFEDFPSKHLMRCFRNDANLNDEDNPPGISM